MKALALHLGHNATAAIMQDGTILGVLSQEKIDNVKNSGAFPIEAAAALCEHAGWHLDGVDQVLLSSKIVYRPDAFATTLDRKNRQHSTQPVIALARRLERSVGAVFPAPFAFARTQLRQRKKIAGERYLADCLKAAKLDSKPRQRVEHHLCHARAAYHAAPRSAPGPVLVFTLDGEGDGISSTVTAVDAQGNWRRLASSPAEHSLGWIYSATTRFLGMKMLEHEYKVMGLAPYAKQYFRDVYERVFAPAIWLDAANPLTFKSPINTAHFYDHLVENAVGERFDNIAAAAQQLIEDMVIAWVRAAIRQTGIGNICTGGGVFMNVKLNKRIQELPEVTHADFLPSCGDESLPIGALYDFAARNELHTQPLPNLYLGNDYSDAQIETFLNSNDAGKDYDVERTPDIERKLAEMIAAGEVVARFAGRGEWGARSLGNRAILAHPSQMESFYTVNDQIKSRDFWMPFAPTILDTFADRYLQGYDPAKTDAAYMITAFEIKPEAVTALRAVMHSGDFSVRPQVLRREANPKYYSLIQHFSEITGVGAVLNTSLNLHGYPLVATPEQALFTLKKSGLKNLALGSFLIRKK